LVCVSMAIVLILFLFIRFGLETVEKMVDWALENVPPSVNPSALEIGCGNGTLLLGLVEAGYGPLSLYGIDYSEGAVKLAQEVAKTRGGTEITYSRCDFLVDDPPAPRSGANRDKVDFWDLLLDKGTYDAIALGPKDEDGRSPAIKYPGRVTRLLTSGGLFLITCKQIMTALNMPA